MTDTTTKPARARRGRTTVPAVTTEASESVVDIVKRTARPKTIVTGALAAAKSPQLSTAVQDGVMDLTQVAAVAELGDLTPDEMARVDRATRGGNLDWTVRNIRVDRDYAAKRAALAADATAHGLKIIEHAPKTGQYGESKTKHQDVTKLVDKTTGKKINPAKHAVECAGHAVALDRSRTDVDRGEPVLVPVCQSPGKYGHILATAFKAPKDPTELKKKQAEDALADAWQLATEQRTEFLTGLVRRTRIQDPVELMIDVLTCRIYSYRDESARAIALLGLEHAPTEWPRYVLLKWAEDTGRRTQAGLAATVAAVEAWAYRISTIRQAVGHADAAKHIQAYLGHLAGFGYQLTPVEAHVAQHGLTPMDVTD